MTYRIRNIVIAVGLALLAMMLTLFYVTSYKRSVQHGAAAVQVYVAARDISAGTTGSDIAAQHGLRLQRTLRSSVVPGAISSPGQIASLVLSTPLYSGEQVTLRNFTNAAEEGIRAQLRGTVRAVQVPGDPNQLLAGTLQTGDHVDLVGNLHTDPNSSVTSTRIVLRNLKVLSAPTAGTTSSKIGSSSTPATSVILAVTDTQVQRLFFVLKNADWTLELRPVVDAVDSPERVESVTSIMTEGTR